MNKLETRVVYNLPNIKPEGAVIWLHGLGADYNDFPPVVNELRLAVSLKFVFPNAPLIPITINNGMKMRAWYDIIDFNDFYREVDSRGIVLSVEYINQLIAELIAEGFSAEQIVIAGFSQGGVIAYYSALNYEKTLAGALILSAYLPDISLLDMVKIQQHAKLPILVCHGSYDQVVKVSYARQATEHLQGFSLNYQWQEYPMEHSLCYEEIMLIGQWLTKIYHK